MMIVDGNHGKVILRPNRQTIDEYKSFLEQWELHEAEMLSFNDLSARTWTEDGSS